MVQYKLNDLMEATKDEVGKETVENLLPAVDKKQEACCLIKVWEC